MDADIQAEIRRELDALGAYDPSADDSADGAEGLGRSTGEGDDDAFDIAALDFNDFALPDEDIEIVDPATFDYSTASMSQQDDTDPGGPGSNALSLLRTQMLARTERADAVSKELEETVTLAAHVDVEEIRALAPNAERKEGGQGIEEVLEARSNVLSEMDDERKRKEEEQAAIRAQRLRLEQEAAAERERQAQAAEAERIRLQQEHEAEAKRIEEERQRALVELQERLQREEDERIRAEQARVAAEEDAKRRLEEQAAREREEAAQAERERKQKAEERAKKMEELNARLEQERKEAMEAERLAAVAKAAEEQKVREKEEEEKRKQEQERQRQERERAEQERKRLAAEAERQRIEEEKERERKTREAEERRLKDEAEKRRLAEEAYRKKKEEEEKAQRQAEEEAKRAAAAEEQRQRQAKEEAERVQELERIEAERQALRLEMERYRTGTETGNVVAVSQSWVEVLAPHTPHAFAQGNASASSTTGDDDDDDDDDGEEVILRKGHQAWLQLRRLAQTRSRPPAPGPALPPLPPPASGIVLDDDMIRMEYPLEDLSKLRLVKLGFENIERISSIQSLPKLQVLVLNNNSLKCFENLSAFPHLKVLSATDNKLESLQGFQESPGLQVVELDSNMIQTLGGFDHSRELRYLSIQVNQIDRIQGLDMCPKLQVLKLYRNNIERMQGLEHLPHLRYLDLGRNRISRIEGLANCPMLESLVLYENAITELPHDLSSGILHSLYLGGNRISSLHNMPWLPALERLALQNNQLTSLGDIPEACPLLQVLDVSFNQIAELDDLRRLHKLEYLVRVSVNDNPVCEVDPETYGNILASLPAIRDVDGDHIDDTRRTAARKTLNKSRLSKDPRAYDHIRRMYPVVRAQHSYQLLAAGRPVPCFPHRPDVWSDYHKSACRGRQEWEKRAHITMIQMHQEERRVLRMKRVSRLGTLNKNTYDVDSIQQEQEELAMLQRQVSELENFEPKQYQSRWTTSLVYNDKVEAVKRTGAARAIQAIWRGHRARILVQDRRRRHQAAARIQALHRGRVARVQYQARLLEARAGQGQAAIKIQALWRGVRTRLVLAKAKEAAAYTDDDDFDYEGVDEHMYDDIDIDMIGLPVGSIPLSTMTSALNAQMHAPAVAAAYSASGDDQVRRPRLHIDVAAAESYNALISPGRESLASSGSKGAPLPLPQAWGSGSGGSSGDGGATLRESELARHREQHAGPSSSPGTSLGSQLGSNFRRSPVAARPGGAGSSTQHPHHQHDPHSPSCQSTATLSTTWDPDEAARLQEERDRKHRELDVKRGKKQEELKEQWGFENAETAEMMMKRRKRLLKLRTKKKKQAALADPQKRFELFQQRQKVNPPPAGLRRTGTNSSSLGPQDRNARPSPSAGHRTLHARPGSRESDLVSAHGNGDWELESVASSRQSHASPLPSIRGPAGSGAASSRQSPMYRSGSGSGSGGGGGGGGGSGGGGSGRPPMGNHGASSRRTGHQQVPVTSTQFSLPPVGSTARHGPGQRTLSAGAVEGPPPGRTGHAHGARARGGRGGGSFAKSR